MVGFALQLPAFFQVSLAMMWIMAFCSATHDIAADGFYMLGLKQHQQAAFVGVRSTFYRLAWIVGGGAVAVLAGKLTETTGSVSQAWSMVFFVLAAVFLALFAWHSLILPRPPADHTVVQSENRTRDFLNTFGAFFKKRDIYLILGFLLTYRLGESQLLKLAAPFLMDPASEGGLGLTTAQVGTVYGTFGMLALTLGGLLGGYLISRIGLKRCLWVMVFALNAPNLVYVYMSTAMPDSLLVIAAFIGVEQFGYGFGFTAMMMYMIMVADGEHKTAHYAICTGLMALGMMVPGMFSGQIQAFLGYQSFFVYVCIMTIPSFILTALVKIDPEFGKK
jgi:PAT family beta-lactamase induction signal transducer AmpG